MKDMASIELEDAVVRRKLDQLGINASDMTKGWKEAQQYMRVRTSQTFRALRLGGTYRGVSWEYFAPQYTRKDGTEVPAWGGIPKVRGEGTVLGRLRPSGARVKQGDSILQDTMTLRSRAAMTQLMTPLVWRMGTNLQYARPQQKRRPFLFFQVPQDANAITKIIHRALSDV